jgi:nucleotide-binding universal stress UspA family protein
MGTKGAWGLKEKLGSTQAQMIVRKSPVPVLSLMCDRSDLIIRDILFVHDFKDADDTDMPLMRTFSKYFNANFHLLYIHDESDGDEASVLPHMDRYAHAHQIENYRNHVVKAADIEAGVLDFLKGQDADIVFVGTHGKGGFFHTSAAESLVKHLFKPIISFHFNPR